MKRRSIRRSRRRSHRRIRRSARESIAMTHFAHAQAKEAGFFANPILFEDNDSPQANPLAENLLVVALLAGAGFGGYYWYKHRTVTANMVSGQSNTVNLSIGQTLVVNAPPGSWVLTPPSQTANVLALGSAAATATSATYTAQGAGSATITAATAGQTATLNVVVS